MEKTIKQSFFGAVIRAPIVEEIVFRFIPFLIYQEIGQFALVGIVSALIYALIHLRFGRTFVVYAFIFGIFAWFVMVNFGLIFAILAHSLLNIIDWKFGIRRILTKGKYTL